MPYFLNPEAADGWLPAIPVRWQFSHAEAVMVVAEHARLQSAVAAINALGDDAPPGRYDEILSELFSALTVRGYTITSSLAKKLGRLLFLRSLLAEGCDPETAFLLAFSE